MFGPLVALALVAAPTPAPVQPGAGHGDDRTTVRKVVNFGFKPGRGFEFAMLPRIDLEVVGRYSVARNVFGARSALLDRDEVGGESNYDFVGHNLKLQCDDFRVWEAAPGVSAADAARLGTDRLRMQIPLAFCAACEPCASRGEWRHLRSLRACWTTAGSPPRVPRIWYWWPLRPTGFSSRITGVRPATPLKVLS